jgi:hypothetical protein
MLRAITLASLFFLSPAVVVTPHRTQHSGGASSVSQDPAPAAPAPAAGELPKAPKPKTKKVWTEDNLGQVGGTISVVGAPQSASKNQTSQERSKSTPGKASNTSVDAQTVASLRQELQKLQSNLDFVDRKLNQLKDFNKGDGKNAGGLKSDTWQYNSSSVEEQIVHLQEQKAKIQLAMDNLLDAARSSGIEPGQLR